MRGTTHPINCKELAMAIDEIFTFHKLSRTTYPNLSITTSIAEPLSETLPNDLDHSCKGYAGCTDD
ncbi:MAG TPA: hypothetical protein VK475_01390 [Pyrinomonadaceae bacterium]|nr:hypothetical protein [Pyrinomonadaceae bacterium]